MPYRIFKVRNKDCFSVQSITRRRRNQPRKRGRPKSVRKFSKCTLREKAERQLRLLRGLEAKRIRDANAARVLAATVVPTTAV